MMVTVIVTVIPIAIVVMIVIGINSIKRERKHYNDEMQVFAKLHMVKKPKQSNGLQCRTMLDSCC